MQKLKKKKTTKKMKHLNCEAELLCKLTKPRGRGGVQAIIITGLSCPSKTNFR